MERDRVDRRQGGNRMQGNSESFPFLWQNLVCHSGHFWGVPHLYRSQAFWRVNISQFLRMEPRVEYERASWDVTEPTLSPPTIEWAN